MYMICMNCISRNKVAIYFAFFFSKSGYVFTLRRVFKKVVDGFLLNSVILNH